MVESESVVITRQAKVPSNRLVLVDCEEEVGTYSLEMQKKLHKKTYIRYVNHVWAAVDEFGNIHAPSKTFVRF